jgi:D-3-phosphoglycerate dehydrogenase
VVIARYGVGVDSIDLGAATDLGIIVANVPDYCMDEVADQTLAMILTLVRKSAFFDGKVKTGRWDFQLGRPIHRLRGKTSGLIGCGRIGLEVAKRISGFGVRVIAFDPYLRKGFEGIELRDFDSVLKESDLLSIHCPLNDTTRHLIGDREFEKMKKSPLVINTSRGAIIDEQALIRALEQGLVSGAGLDVLEKEPPDSQNPLLRMENVILSPHIGFYVLTGRWPRSFVNKEVKGKTRAFIPG